MGRDHLPGSIPGHPDVGEADAAFEAGRARPAGEDAKMTVRVSAGVRMRVAMGREYGGPRAGG